MSGPLRYAAPKTDDQFEDFCLALLRVHYALPGLERNGRRGQRQFGIDIIDLQSQPPLLAAQCKADDTNLVFHEQRLRDLVADALRSPYELSRFVVLSTGKTSTRLQQVLSEINAEHFAAGRFIVEFKSWDLIERILDNHPDLAQDKLTIVTNAAIQSVDRTLHGIAADVSEIKDQKTKDTVDNEISQAKDEIERRDFPLAKSRLSKLRRDRWHDLSGFQRFQVLSNLGNIESAKGAFREAAKLYLESASHAPHQVAAQEAEALGYLLLQDYDKAFDLASAVRSRAPESWKAAPIRIYAAPASIDLPALVAELTPQDMIHAEVLIALASRAHTEKRFKEGEAYARDAIKASEKEWPFTKMVLAQCISHSVMLGSGSRPIDSFTPQDLLRIDEADDLFNQCIVSARARGENQLAAPALIERAGIAERRGNEDTARQLVEDAYHLAPHDPQARSGYATLLERRGEMDRAIRLLEQLTTDESHIAYRHQLAGALSVRGEGNDDDRATALLMDIGRSNEPLTPHFRYEVLAQTLARLAKAKRISEGRDLIKAVPQGKLSPVAENALVARLCWHANDEATARLLLQTAESFLTETSVDIEVELIAATYGSFGEYRKALPLWKRVARPGNLLALRQAFACAQRLGEHAALLDICQRLRDAELEDANSVQVEADLLQDDDIDAAVAVLQGYLKRHPDDVHVKLRLSHIGMEHERIELIQGPNDPLPDVKMVDPYYARGVTYYLKFVGRGDEALRYGYEILHRHFDDVDAHRAFILLFLPMGPSVRIDVPEVAGPGTAIEYLEEGVPSTCWHVIEDEMTPDPRLQEFSVSHPISRAMTGKRVGDRVELAPGSISPRPAAIKQIVHKYAYRASRCSEEFQLRFPDATELQVMHFPSGPDGQPDVTKLLETMQHKTEATQQAIAMYTANPLPLHFVGGALHGTCFDAIQYLINDPNSIVRCAPDGMPDRKSAVEAVEAAEQIVLDLSAIATLVFTGRADLVKKLGRPVFISQGCDEELKKITEKARDGLQWSDARFAWVGGRDVAVPISEGDRLLRERMMSDALSDIRSAVTVESCRELSAMSVDQKDPMIKIFDRHGAQAIILAKRPGRVLWSDDFVQSGCANHQFGAKPIWSEIVAGYLEGKGLLERKVAVEFVSDLLGFRYQSIMITPAVFIEAARRSGWNKNTAPFTYALQPLLYHSPESVFALVGGVATEIEREIQDAGTKELLIRAFVSTLLSREDGVVTIGLLRQVFQSRSSQRSTEWITVIDRVVSDLYSQSRW